jgi:hypothetical protein
MKNRLKQFLKVVKTLTRRIRGKVFKECCTVVVPSTYEHLQAYSWAATRIKTFLKLFTKRNKFIEKIKRQNLSRSRI